MTTTQDCIILYSYSDVRETGSAMTCRGKVEQKWHAFTSSWQAKSFTDQYGKPLPENVIVWQYRVI